MHTLCIYRYTYNTALYTYINIYPYVCALALEAAALTVFMGLATGLSRSRRKR